MAARDNENPTFRKHRKHALALFGTSVAPPLVARKRGN
jgi:hypothetical protein